MSMSGYPLFLPDMIGGNAYVEQPDAELMIRWAQVNALMPGMQFSLAPWDYGEETSRLCREAALLHQQMAPDILKAVENSVLSGEPVIRPLFWIAPGDPVALTCDDQFLLGDMFLAAPIVTRGQRKRDIYLPVGHWVDKWSGQVHDGPTWLRDYPTPLDVLPLFRLER